MAKDKIILVENNTGNLNDVHHQNHGMQFKRLMKLLFGSQSILVIAISMMALAVLNGDIMSSFTNGLIVNLGDFLTDIMGGYSYPVAMIIGGLMLIGPVHVYAVDDKISMIIVVFITFFITGLLLGRMFKHPAWALASGFVVMASFIILITSLIGIVDYLADQTFGMTISPILYSVIEGIFDMSAGEIFTYSIIENGLLLGLCSMLWGVIFMPKNNQIDPEVSVQCDDGGICKI